MKKYKKFSRYFVVVSFIVLVLILSINVIVDPYSMTKYNLLKIPNKFARDDRAEKISKLYMDDRYDNMIFGSSRVYVTDPLIINKYLGGITYNCGVGRARIEDQLGFLLFLQRQDKLPKNAIFGLDFYSFNENLESNKYFMKNRELNFIQNSKYSNFDMYTEKLFSIDALRASYKTLKNYLVNKQEVPRFDEYGSALSSDRISEYSNVNLAQLYFSKSRIESDKRNISTLKYDKVSEDRLLYLDTIIEICENNNMSCLFMTTPLNGQMLEEFTKDKKQRETLQTFKNELSKRTAFYDFLNHNKITDNRAFFVDTMHFTPLAGNLLFARIFHDRNVSLPEKFGVYIEKD